MWKVNEESIAVLNFEEICPEEILFEFNGPQIFTFLQGQLQFFAYTSFDDEDSRVVRLLAVSTNPLELRKLKEGELSIEDVLRKNLVWAIDRSYDGKTLRVALLSHGLDDVPNGFKPKNGVLLWAHLKRENQARSLVDQKAALQRVAVLAEKIRRSSVESEKAALHGRYFTDFQSPYGGLVPSRYHEIGSVIVTNYSHDETSAMRVWGYGQRMRDEEKEVGWGAGAVDHSDSQETHQTGLMWYAKHTRSKAYG